MAVLPAAGRATRLSHLPCSKEVLPVGLGNERSVVAHRVKVVSHYILESLFFAGIKTCFVIIDPAKTDIPKYLKNNAGIDGLEIAYRSIENSPNTPSTLDSAYPFVKNKWLALGFPDMVLPDSRIFSRLVNQCEEGVDVLLGLFPASQPHNVDMVDVGPDGRVCNLLIKPAETVLSKTWGIALWSPRFSQFMHDYLSEPSSASSSTPLSASSSKELFVGDVIIAALQKGFNVKGVDVSELPYLDIGTVENYGQLFTTMQK